MVDVLWGIFVALFLFSLLLALIAEEVYGGYRKQEDFLMGWALTLIISAFIVAGTAIYITKGEQDELTSTDRVVSNEAHSRASGGTPSSDSRDR